jgi:predicted metal-dependent hydrolase
MKYEYTVIRSKRRTLALEITPELTVRVRAPLRASDRTIRQLIDSHIGWIEKTLERQRKRGAARPRLSEEEIGTLRRTAADLIPPRVAHYAAVMGLHPTGVKITGAEKRYGSCSGKNSLCFSYRLLLCPDAAIDYVVVHELAHIRHKNHGREFYALIASVLPDYKQRRKLLKA